MATDVNNTDRIVRLRGYTLVYLLVVLSLFYFPNHLGPVLVCLYLFFPWQLVTR